MKTSYTKVTDFSTIIAETTNQDTKVFVSYNDGQDAFVTLPVRVHPTKVDEYIKKLAAKILWK